MCYRKIFDIPYYFGYIKNSSFPSRMLRKSKTCIIANFHRTGLVICSHFRETEPCLIAE